MPDDQPSCGCLNALSNSSSALLCFSLGMAGRKKPALMTAFCASVSPAGNSSSTSTMRSPRPAPPGMGMPSPATRVRWPGLTMSEMGTDNTLESSVGTSIAVPHNAWYRGSVTLCTRSEPRRLKRACGSGLSTKMTGPAARVGVLLPSPSNTKRVPVGSPGLTSIVNERCSSVYSPPSARSTLRLCVTRFKQPWKISSNVSSTVYTLFLPCLGGSVAVMDSNCWLMASSAS
mmetsp:Transcript_56883/g.116029  ORF Transcript_56883/g.116029 Transcript_56883/m.116029 type:complete len:231 (-) Transcript_56883:36-728(-)